MTTIALPVQAQNFSLSGAGSSIGDTVLNLKSFKDILGVNLAMVDFGSIGYGTLEPGNGSQEEQISFSGVTQNVDGTAQLTGVKHVLFKSPYTESSGMTITHPGSVTFVISNTSAYENTLYQALNSAVASGGVPASSTQLGITKLSVNPVLAASPIAVGDNDSRVPLVNASSITTGQLAALFGDNSDITLGSGNKYVTQTGLQKTSENFATSTGVANTYAVTLSPVPASLSSGQTVSFLANFTNVDASGSTLNVNGLGAKPLKRNYNIALAGADITAGQIVQASYDGANFQVISPLGNTVGESFVGAPYNSGNLISTQNVDTVYTAGFTAKNITIYYQLGGANGSATQLYTTGTATWNGTSLVSNMRLSTNVGVATAFSNSSTTIDNSAVTAGNNSGSGSNSSATLTIISVTSTQFTVRAAFTSPTAINTFANFYVVATK